MLPEMELDDQKGKIQNEPMLNYVESYLNDCTGLAPWSSAVVPKFCFELGYPTRTSGRKPTCRLSRLSSRLVFQLASDIYYSSLASVCVASFETCCWSLSSVSNAYVPVST